MSTRTFVTAAAALAAAWVCSAAGASADGGPSPGTAQGRDGVATRDGSVRYVALAHGGSTVVQAIRTPSGRVMRWGWIEGEWGVPLVTVNGQAEGLSRDERTLLLGEAAYVQPTALRTRFALVDSRRLRLKSTITLQGAFTYDTLSPDARTVYLIQYLPAMGPANYQVRAYDLKTRRLVPGAIVDKRAADEDMQGTPVARTATGNGAWVFTLYARESTPFVHALDTLHRRAVCIDLPWEAPDAIFKVRLRVDAGRLVLEQPNVGRLAVVDMQTWKVTSFRQPEKR